MRKKRMIVKLRNFISIILVAILLTMSFTLRIFASESGYMVGSNIEQTNEAQSENDNLSDEKKEDEKENTINANVVTSSEKYNLTVKESSDLPEKDETNEATSNTVETSIEDNNSKNVTGNTSEKESSNKVEDNNVSDTQNNVTNNTQNDVVSNSSNNNENTNNAKNNSTVSAEAKTAYTNNTNIDTSANKQEIKVSINMNNFMNSYSWNAQKDENKSINLNILYNIDASKKYNKNALKVTVPGIGNLKRESCLKAIVTADMYSATEKKYDWSYTYNESTDTYTFFNNNVINEGNIINGTIELTWTFEARDSKNGYNKTLQAAIENVEDSSSKVFTNEIEFKFTSKKDTFEIKKDARLVISENGLAEKIESINKENEEKKENEKNEQEENAEREEIVEKLEVEDFLWVEYIYTYNTKDLNSRGLKERYIEETYPDDCIIIGTYDVISEDLEQKTVTYKFYNEDNIKAGDIKRNSIIVGYPEKYIEDPILSEAKLVGNYLDEEGTENVATCNIEINVEKIDEENAIPLTNWAGNVIKECKDITPNFIEKDKLNEDINFTTNVYANTKVKPESKEYGMSIACDLIQVYAESGFKTLNNDEYEFTKVTIPKKDNFYKKDDNLIQDDNYKVIVKVTDDNGKETKTEYLNSVWEKEDIAQELTNAKSIKVEIIGITDKIEDFYVIIEGKVNISNYIAQDAKYIIAYNYTDYFDDKGNSIVDETSMQNYSRSDLYKYDVKGKTRRCSIIKLEKADIQIATTEESKTGEAKPEESKENVVEPQNETKRGNIILNVKDEVDGTKIQGVKCGLYAENDIINEESKVVYSKDTLIQEKLSDINGKLVFNEIMQGDYYIKQIDTVYGYTTSNSKELYTINNENVENSIEKSINIARNNAKVEIPFKNEANEPIDGLEVKLFDENGVEKNITITYSNGIITIDDIKWGNYYLKVTNLSNIYEEINDKYSFTINRETFKESNIVSNVTNSNNNKISQLTAILRKATLRINKSVSESSLELGNGNANFVFKIVAKDENGNKVFTLYRGVTFTKEDLTGNPNAVIIKSIDIPNLDHYKYEITEMKNFRFYSPEIIVNAEKNSSCEDLKGIVNLNGTNMEGEITFLSRRANYSLLSDSKVLKNY